MILVAILDSGLARDRTEFGALCVRGREFGQYKPNPLWRKGMPTTQYWLPRIVDDTTDDYGHGTHVAGIVVANAPFPVSIMPVKICDHQGDTTPGAIEEGIIYAVDRGAKIINLSSGEVTGQYIDAAIEYAEAAGVLIVAAAGNDSSREEFYPAAAQYVLSVGAVNHAGDKASFSNYGAWVTCYAPGVNINSTVPTYPCHYWSRSGRLTLSGTSMAAPYVSALASEWVSKGYSPIEIRKAFGTFSWKPTAVKPALTIDRTGGSANVVAKPIF